MRRDTLVSLSTASGFPGSWDRWQTLFEEAGYATLTPGWPDDPETVEEAKAHPEVFAHKIDRAGRRPLRRGDRQALTEAGDHRPLVRRAAHPDPSPAGARGGVGGHRPGAVPRRAAAADLGAALGLAGAAQPGQPQPRRPLTYEQFRYAFANAGQRGRGEGALRDLRRARLREPLFQAAAANLNPWTEAKVDTKNPERGPLLIISGEKDHTVPWAIANASYKRQKRNEGVTEIVKIPGRGHALTIDSGWRGHQSRSLPFTWTGSST